MKIIDKNSLLNDEIKRSIERCENSKEFFFGASKSFYKGNIDFVFGKRLEEATKNLLHFTVEINTIIVVNRKTVAIDGNVIEHNDYKFDGLVIRGDYIWKWWSSKENEKSLKAEFSKNRELFTEKEQRNLALYQQRYKKRNHQEVAQSLKALYEKYNSNQTEVVEFQCFEQEYASYRHTVIAKVIVTKRIIQITNERDEGIVISSQVHSFIEKRKPDEIELIEEWKEDGIITTVFSIMGKYERATRKGDIVYKKWKVKYNNNESVIVTKTGDLED